MIDMAIKDCCGGLPVRKKEQHGITFCGSFIFFSNLVTEVVFGALTVVDMRAGFVESSALITSPWFPLPLFHQSATNAIKPQHLRDIINQPCLKLCIYGRVDPFGIVRLLGLSGSANACIRPVN